MLGLLISASFVAASDDIVNETQSFENGVPKFVSVAKGRVSISESRVQHGEHSLRWDWVPGDTLTLATGPLGNINVYTGYGGYSRSAFQLHIYTETLSEGALSFRWLAGNELGARFDFPLVFPGWQRICYHYSWSSKLKDHKGPTLAKADRIEIAAPTTGNGGTVYLDSLDFNRPLDFRDAREPVTQLWKPVNINELKDPTLLAPPTAAESAGAKHLLTLLAASGNRKLTDNDAANVEKKLRDKYDLRRSAAGRATGKIIPNFAAAVGSDLLSIANTWAAAGLATAPEVKGRLEDAYFLLDDFFREAGAVAQGNLGNLSSYGGREHGSACFIMQAPLRRSGRLERVRNCLKFHWGYDEIFKTPEPGQAMGTDYFYIDTHYLMRIALMHDTESAVVSHLRAFARRYNLDVLNTIEPDGSVYHHGFYNFPYVSGSMLALANQIQQLSTTPFAVSPGAFADAKLAALNMRWFCNLTDSPIFMHGRHPGRLRLSERQYAVLAEAGRAYNSGKLDRDLASAFLRIVPADAAKPQFTAEKIAAEPAPQGTHALNYAAMLGHRRGEWLAVVRGYSKYHPAQESYNNANRHGLFLGNGYLDILAGGNPINIVASGCDVAKGWDWRQLDGTTTFMAPYAKIANGNGTMSEYSDIGFVGGLSHSGKNGIFDMPLHSRSQYLRALPDGAKADPHGYFTANKSYFFFENRIVCLGSDIALPGSTYEVRTTLFQKQLPQVAVPVTLDGRPANDFPFQVSLRSEQAHTLVDTQNTGYFVPAGQKLNLVRAHQKSRDGHDNQDTEGDAAIAYLSHGESPTQAGYEYVILVQTTPAGIAEFSTAMAGSEQPIVVWRKDHEAHIVYDRGTKSWGGVVYTKSLELPGAAQAGLPVTTVTGPCLFMLEKLDRGQATLSIADPDIHRLKRTSQPSNVSLTIAGAWKPTDVNSPVKTETARGQTTLTVTCIEGRSYTVTLQQQP